MKGLLLCTDIFFLGDLDEGIEKYTKDENKDNVKEADVWNIERIFLMMILRKKLHILHSYARLGTNGEGMMMFKDVDWNGFSYSKCKGINSGVGKVVVVGLSDSNTTAG